MSVEHQTITIPEFSPGLRADIDPSLLPPGAASACANVIMDTGTLRVRPGREREFPATDEPDTVRAMAELHTEAGTLLYAVTGDHVQYYGPGPGAATGTTLDETDTEFGQPFIGCGRADFDGFKNGSGTSVAISFKASRSGAIASLAFPWRSGSGAGAGNGGRYDVALHSNLLDSNTPAGEVLAQLLGVDMATYMGGSSDGPACLPLSVELVAEQIYHLVITNTATPSGSNYGSLSTVMDQVTAWSDWASSGRDARLLCRVNSGAWGPWGSAGNQWHTSGGTDFNGSHVALLIAWADGVVTGNAYQANTLDTSMRLNSGTVKIAERFTLAHPHTLDILGVALRKVGNPGRLHYLIETAPNAGDVGTVIMTGTFPSAALAGLGASPQAMAYHTLPSPVPLAADTAYRIAFYVDAETAGSANYYEQNPPYSFVQENWTAASWGGGASCAQLWTGTDWVSHEAQDLALSLLQRDSAATEDTSVVGWHPVVMCDVATTQPARLQAYKQAMYLVDSTHHVRKIVKGTASDLRDEPTPAKAAIVNEGSAQMLVGPWGVGHETGSGHGAEAGHWVLSINNVSHFVYPRIWDNAMAFNAEWLGTTWISNQSTGNGVTVRRFAKQDGADAYNAIITDTETPLAVEPTLGLEILGTSASISANPHVRMKAQIPGNGLNLIPATTLQLKFKVLASVLPTAMTLQLGKEDKANGNLAIVKTIDFFPDDGDTVNKWLTKTVTISEESAAIIGSVKFVSLDFTFLQDTVPSARLPLPGGQGFLPTETQAITVLVDYVRADISNSSFLPNEEYDFLYAYRWGSGSDVRESPPNNVLTKRAITDIYSLPTSLEISVTKDTLSPPPTVARLYVQGGKAGTSFIKLADIDLSGDSPYTFSWNGDFSGDVIPMPTFVNAPRTMASLCYTHKGRMFYAAPPPDTYALDNDGVERPTDRSGLPHDTLYLSNWDDPDRVPIEMMLETPETYGGWITIGEDGRPITGLGAWGSYLLIFKYAGVWRLDGATAQDISLVPMSTTAGCISHETVQQVGDGLTVWLGRDKVWAATPEGIQSIGQAIEARLRQTTRAQQEAAFAVYDKRRNWYLLTIPSVNDDEVVGDTAYEATTYVLYPLAAGGFGWSVWTEQAQGCACYGEHLDKPGAYAADHAEISHLNTGCTDAGAPIAYSWRSGRMTLGDALRLKTVTEVRAIAGKDVRERDETLLEAVDLQLTTADDSTLAQQALAVPAASRVARWRVPLMRPTEAMTLTVSGATTSGGEISALTADVLGRGGVR